jgi:DNA-binding transcriptional MerR regulator
MRSYDLSELEAESALSRRTISDYVSRGLLSGPSHRGRGARYSQRDLDALRVIPLLRTVLKSEFPSLNALREFLDNLSLSDLSQLAGVTDEGDFETRVRRIRVHNRLRAILPIVSPERLSEVLNGLTPEQISGVDRGQYQIGSLVDFERLSSAGTVGNGETEWAHFGTSTVQVRIEKGVIGTTGVDPRVAAAIHDFTIQIESLLKGGAGRSADGA